MANNTPFNKPKQIYVNPDELEVIEPKLPPLPVVARANSTKKTTALQPLQPKGSIEQPTEEQIAGLENEIAMAQTPQGNNPMFQRSPEEEELKQKSINYFLSQLDKPVEIPQKLTIQDILNGKTFGDRLAAFSDYAQTPEAQAAIGRLFGGLHRNPITGEITTAGERLSRQAEAKLLAEQERAKELRKEQTGLAKDIYGIMNSIDTEAMREDRFNRQLQQNNEQFYQSLGAKREENALDRDLRRQEFEQRQAENQEAIQRQLEQQQFNNQLALERLELEKEKARKENGAELAKDDKKTLTSNNQTIAQIEAGLKAIEENPNAYTFMKGLVGPDVANRIDPKGVKTRSQIDNITAVYRKWLTGAQMSDKERKDYERFLPAPKDNAQIVKSKLQAMKESIQRNNEAIMSNYGQNQNSEANIDLDPMGLGF